ncbi:DUF433 domain-containing protein [Phormidesmis priestleyi]|uniref:DUF433 domain-containing protein n=1 Tax=Phormidesmis priestleyi TaxID=268141 RepID=UPI001CB994BC|nr:hypothetical protein [Phormidesmis priestleyi]
MDTVVAAFLEGAAAEIGEHYPLLQISDIYSVVAYYLRHQTEVAKMTAFAYQRVKAN